MILSQLLINGHVTAVSMPESPKPASLSECPADPKRGLETECPYMYAHTHALTPTRTHSHTRGRGRIPSEVYATNVFVMNKTCCCCASSRPAITTSGIMNNNTALALCMIVIINSIRTDTHQCTIALH